MKTKHLLATLLLACTTVTFAQVGIGTQTPHASSMLEVSATAENKGLLPPRMTQAQRDAIASPAEGLTVFNTTTGCLEFFNGTCWICHLNMPKDGSAANKGALSCKAIKDANPSAVDGTYWLDIDGCGPIASMQAYCDMTTDGGGWTLIGQHNHSSGLVAPFIRDNFPNRGSDNPSLNERPAGLGIFGTFGMINQPMRQVMNFTEYRVESYFTGSGFHFKSTDTNFIKNNTAEITAGKTSLGKPSYWPAATTYYVHCNSVFGGVPLQEATRVTFHHSGPSCYGFYLLSRISSDNALYTNEGLQPPGHATVNGLGRLWVR